ncbi:MAG: aminoglycoside phosphotransferase family protein [Fibrobacterota bacterium]
MSAPLIDLKPIVRPFAIEGEYLDGGPYGTGHINDTYAVRFRAPKGEVRYILQRINHHVFKQPVPLMENVERVTAHLRKKIEKAGGDPFRETLNLVPAIDGKTWHLTAEGNYWRVYRFIEGAQTYDKVENLDMVYQASFSFGKFQEAMADLPGKRVNETIPNFHHTRKRFEALQEAVKKDAKNRAKDVRAEIDFAFSREVDASRLVDLLDAGQLPERTTHNDTKLNNVMIDDKTGKGICVIDLDTVMPGLPLYDFGDSVRIGASTAVEDERDLSKVGMDIGMFERLAHGYLDAARGFLTPLEKKNLAFSGKLLTFECGMRFLADHLAGDTYFRIHREAHNLDRCRTQFKMVADMEKAMGEMERIVEKYC